MSDFFEIDFLDVETDKSGDAIPLRYQVNGQTYIHVVDGGYKEVGQKIIDHINGYYEGGGIDHVVVTHPDGDHTTGLQTVLEAHRVDRLWMLRPWIYAEELLPRFSTYNSADRLRSKLRTAYPNIAKLEEIALANGIPIYEPFQGASIGAFKVLAPSRARYLDLVVESEKTPEAKDVSLRIAEQSVSDLLLAAFKKAINFVKGMWGEEVFSPNGTSAENEMSVIQAAVIDGKSIVLTGDAGRNGLAEAADAAWMAGLFLPGVDRFQVPHHGSRRNVSTEVLDRWLGERLPAQLAQGEEVFTAICSSAKKDAHHPRKAVERAFVHRGGKFVATEGVDVVTRHNAPPRDGYEPINPRPYPVDYEQ